MTISPEDNNAIKLRGRTMLGQVLGFSDCAPTVLDAMHAMGKPVSLSRGQYLMRREDSVSDFYLVVDGALESSVQYKSGKRHLLSLVMPGEVFGLKNLADPYRQQYDLIARAPSQLMAYPIEGMRKLRLIEPTLVLACERHLAFRTWLLFERLSFDAGVRLDVRVAKLLVMLASMHGVAGPGGVVLDVKLSQSDLADLLGLSRQRLNFALKQLQREGLIELRYSTVIIPDVRKLKERSEL